MDNLNPISNDVKFTLVIRDVNTTKRLAKIEAPDMELVLEKLGALERYLQKQNLTIQEWTQIQ